ncbi:MAG: 1,4-dihydroxy-2-naphthoate octaprenyltransferase [Akkermansia sp.]
MSRLKSVFLAARPKTLPAGLVAVWAGWIVVTKYAALFPELHLRPSVSLAVLTALSCVCIQIACNFFNDALDAENGKDTAGRMGPARMTAGGQMSARAVKLWGCAFAGLAVLFGLPLVLAQGWVVVAIGVPSLFFAYGYTGGPFPLAYHGLGELFVMLFFGLVAVTGTVFVQAGWQPGYGTLYCCASLVGVVCGSLSCLLIEVNNIRDRVEDARTGKRTLAVRLGDSRARGLAMAFLLVPYATIRQVSFFLPSVHWSLFWCAPILVGGCILVKLHTTPADKRMNSLLALAALHMLLYMAALSL